MIARVRRIAIERNQCGRNLLAEIKMDDTLLTLLRGVDTPTVCNAVEVAQGRRGLNAFTRGTMLCSAPDGPAVVGYACTAKIAGLAPPSESAASIRARRMDYYRMMAEAAPVGCGD
jgi:hypothetical protein